MIDMMGQFADAMVTLGVTSLENVSIKAMPADESVVKTETSPNPTTASFNREKKILTDYLAVLSGSVSIREDYTTVVWNAHAYLTDITELKKEWMRKFPLQ